VSIELENFKSFSGHHVLGPFLNLTAVVGPNGGGKQSVQNYHIIGKSNILDAIAFTLLLRHISKKHKHLKELIYREEHEKYLDNKREMFV
jgi:structural maintenance of chromosome 1